MFPPHPSVLPGLSSAPHSLLPPTNSAAGQKMVFAVSSSHVVSAAPSSSGGIFAYCQGLKITLPASQEFSYLYSRTALWCGTDLNSHHSQGRAVQERALKDLQGENCPCFIQGLLQATLLVLASVPCLCLGTHVLDPELDPKPALVLQLWWMITGLYLTPITITGPAMQTHP